MNSRRNFLKTSFFAAFAFSIPKNVIASFGQKLTNVLILGDSISIGYTPFVKELLEGKANVFRPMQENGKAENCQGTTNGVKNIDRWIGDIKWDVIHFNFGLHDIKHVDPVTGQNSKNPEHPHQADLKQYKKNMKAIVKTLKATQAKLIFATTTPYPDETTGPLRKPGMPKEYNKVALKIMKSNGVAIDDLYSFVLPRMEELQRPNNVHFTQNGSKVLGEQVVKSILDML